MRLCICTSQGSRRNQMSCSQVFTPKLNEGIIYRGVSRAKGLSKGWWLTQRLIPLGNLMGTEGEGIMTQKTREGMRIWRRSCHLLIESLRERERERCPHLFLLPCSVWMVPTHWFNQKGSQTAKECRPGSPWSPTSQITELGREEFVCVWQGGQMENN